MTLFLHLLQGPAALLHSYQEFISLITLTVEDYVADWEAGNHTLEESEAEITRLGNVRGRRPPGMQELRLRDYLVTL